MIVPATQQEQQPHSRSCRHYQPQVSASPPSFQLQAPPKDSRGRPPARAHPPREGGLLFSFYSCLRRLAVVASNLAATLLCSPALPSFLVYFPEPGRRRRRLASRQTRPCPRRPWPKRGLTTTATTAFVSAASRGLRDCEKTEWEEPARFAWQAAVGAAVGDCCSLLPNCLPGTLAAPRKPHFLHPHHYSITIQCCPQSLLRRALSLSGPSCRLHRRRSSCTSSCARRCQQRAMRK